MRLISHQPVRPSGSRHAGAFTLVEAIMSMLVVSVLLVAAMRATTASALMQYKNSERALGGVLADSLINEVLVLSYTDPTSPSGFGLEAGESTTSKVGWDDVDDFAGWSESPPQDRNGTPMAGLSGWRRTVSVQRVLANDPSQPAGSETGVKRITVTVLRNGLVVATRTALRTSAP
ncbi:type IV pilus modification PilV family protein [Fontivita pretiosa]|uniref:type IV pilus modification PilV family protein n=1 Tax=Fontivita pretiosa TaxID=2989684 RepID=UPI003D162616